MAFPKKIKHRIRNALRMICLRLSCHVCDDFHLVKHLLLLHSSSPMSGGAREWQQMSNMGVETTVVRPRAIWVILVMPRH